MGELVSIVWLWFPWGLDGCLLLCKERSHGEIYTLDYTYNTVDISHDAIFQLSIRLEHDAHVCVFIYLHMYVMLTIA